MSVLLWQYVHPSRLDTGKGLSRASGRAEQKRLFLHEGELVNPDGSDSLPERAKTLGRRLMRSPLPCGRGGKDNEQIATG
jgi:hypothetical protein